MDIQAIFRLVSKIQEYLPAIETVVHEVSGLLKVTAPSTPTVPTQAPANVTKLYPTDTIKGIQQLLNNLLNANLKVDGIFGALTQAAMVKAFAHYGITLPAVTK